MSRAVTIMHRTPLDVLVHPMDHFQSSVEGWESPRPNDVETASPTRSRMGRVEIARSGYLSVPDRATDQGKYNSMSPYLPGRSQLFLNCVRTCSRRSSTIIKVAKVK